ncbi:MAG: aminotransferase class I/II-fold pyridoxal phosphate-dependent enzyme, partial [Actinomycetota bacterium]
FTLAPEAVDPRADLVVVGNPNNPTGTLDPAETLARLARSGRLLVVDEAFMDLVPGQAESLAGRRDLPGVAVVRSPTKSLGLPGVRAGYLVAPPEVVAALRAARQPWSVSTPALAVLEAYAAGVVDTEVLAAEVAQERARLAGSLARLPGVVVWPSAANFLLLRVPDGPATREGLHRRGIAVRRGDTFPGLTPDHLRVAVRTPEEDDRLAELLQAELAAQARDRG